MYAVRVIYIYFFFVNYSEKMRFFPPFDYKLNTEIKRNNLEQSSFQMQARLIQRKQGWSAIFPGIALAPPPMGRVSREGTKQF